MESSFVPTGFDPPAGFAGPGFRLEPLGPEHNERDHAAWSSSIDHVRTTPGFGPERDWPVPMSLDRNRRDLEGHARDFADRTGFTYTILDGDAVIGCVYIYPSTEPDRDAMVSSWVTAERAAMDVVVWRAVSAWLESDWPFGAVDYAARNSPRR